VLDGGARLSAPVTVAVLDPGPPDGVRVDQEGRLWSSCASGVQVLLPGAWGEPATRLGTIRLPQRAANLAFGGPEGDVLAITATDCVYRVATTVRGCRTTG